MLQKINLKLDRKEILAFRVQDKIFEDDVKRTIALLEPELESSEKFNIYLELEQLEGITLPALKERISFMVKQYKDVFDKVTKVALVSDAEWLKKMVSEIHELLPGISLEHYPVNESEKAIQWLTE